MSVKVSASGAVAGLGTVITAWLGGWDAALRALLIFMALDLVTGFLAAYRNKRVDSNVMFWGGIRKLVILVVVIISVLLDGLAGNNIPLFRTLIIYYYVAREGLSAIENIGLLGVPLPKFLTDALAQLQPPGEENKEVKR